MSYVYFAQAGDYVKIGFSYRPEHRVKGLLNRSGLTIPADLNRQTSVRLLHVLPDCICKDERRVHALFDEWRVDGEWFRGTPAFMRALADLNYETIAEERSAARRARAAKKLKAAA